jgi:Pectate lyase superfamily protein
MKIIRRSGGSVTGSSVRNALAEDLEATREALLIDALNVKTFGAVGDGVADDTAEIQAALDAAGTTKSSRTVYLPSGIYKITSPLVIKQQGTSLIGDGIFSTVINQATSSAHAIKWDAPNNVQYTAIRHLSITGVGADVSTGTAIYARSDTGPGNFFASQFLIENVRVTGFQTGVWAQNAPKVSITDSLFINNQIGCRLTKADTFLIENVAMGASGVTASTTGIILENSSAPFVSGSNFGGIVKLGEYGDLDRFMHVSGGSVVTVIEPNVERCGSATTQEAIYLAGTAKMTWLCGRISNGTGDSTMAIFRLYCDAGGDVPTLTILGNPKLDGGSIRTIESFGGLYGKSAISAIGTAALDITYASTAGGTAIFTSRTSPLRSFASLSSMGNTSASRAMFGYIPGGTNAADIAVVTAKDATGTYARRNLINDALHKVVLSSATILSSAAGAETTLSTTALPAYTMPAVGWTTRIKVMGKFANNSNNKRVRLSIGSPAFYVIYDSGSAAFQNSSFEIDITWIARAAAQSYFSAKCWSDDAAPPPSYIATTNSNSFDAALDFRVNTTGVAAGDVTIQGIIIECVKNASEN